MGKGARLRAATIVLALFAFAPAPLLGSAGAGEGSWDATITGEPAKVLELAPVEDPLETGAIQPKVKQPAGAPILAETASLSGDDGRTTFRLGLSKGVTAEVFTLANPYRVVVDLPDVVFGLGQTTGRDGRGLVRAFRYGLFAEGKARVVLDASGPVKIEKAAMSAGADGRSVELQIDLVPMPAETFGAGTGALRPLPHQQKTAAIDEPAPRPKTGTKPVIMIDAGHGGVDPGAVGASNIYEKAIALAVALELRKELMAGGRYDVRLTRSSDVFVSLDHRLRLSRTSGADLFISLHADSLEQKALAQSIRGATVYTLSERASDNQARLMAEKENASDLIAGLDAAETDGRDQVKNILIDLMKRETANFSADFSKLLVSRLGKSVSLSRDPQRSAAFKVLKQTYAPAVLIELGYMSHAEDEKLLNSPEWQHQVASSVRASVDAFFAKQTARARQ